MTSGWEHDLWDDTTSSPRLSDGTAERVLRGAFREEIYGRLTERLREAVFIFLSEHDRLTLKEQDARIRATFIRPAIIEYNREAGVIGDDLLPLEAENELFNRVRGFGPLQHFYDDDTGITEIMCDGPGQPVYYERDGLFHDTDITLSEEMILLTVERLQGLGGVPLGYHHPTVEINLPKARIIAHDKTFVPGGPTICMRMRRSNPYTGRDMVAAGVLREPILLFLAHALQAGANIIVAGPTGSYKTTLAQSLIDLLPEWHRIVTIEDPIEFSLRRRRLLQMEVRRDEGLTPRVCLFHALRNNPTNIVQGEVRDSSALDLVDLMSTGQGGSLCTIHATTPLDALHRLEGLCLRASENVRIESIRASILNAVNLIVVLQKKVYWSDAGERCIGRRLTHVTEMTGLNQDYELTDILRWDDGRLCNTGNGLSPDVYELLSDAGLAEPDMDLLAPVPNATSRRRKEMSDAL